MKIETVALEDQQTKLIAELDAETLERYKRQAARKISQSAKIPGFRPGKAPYDLVRRMYGDEALQQEAVELMLDEIYPQVLREANIEPGGPGKLEEIVSMDPPTFAFVVPLPPEVVLGDYKSIHKDYEPEEITDDKIDHTLMHLQRSYASAEPVERPAQKGDLVSFKVSALRVNPEEGEDANLIAEMPYQMVAGEEDEEEGQPWPYAGFTNELVGLSVDETKTFNHTFSEESDFENLRGKEAQFMVVVQSVKEMHLPELTDEFAQTLGEFETMEDLRKAVKTQLEQNYRQEYDQKFFEDVINELVTQSTIKYPPHLLDEEIEEFVKGVERSLERDRLDLDTYLKMREMNRETFIEQEVKPSATRRLERSLVLEEFARQEKVEVNSEEIRSIYYTALQQIEQTKDLNKGRNKLKQSPRELANSIAINTVNSIYNQRLMSRLKSLATGMEEETVEALDLAAGDLEMLEAAEEELEEMEAAANEVDAEAVADAGTVSAEASAITREEAAEDEMIEAEDQLVKSGTEGVIEQAVNSDETPSVDVAGADAVEPSSTDETNTAVPPETDKGAPNA